MIRRYSRILNFSEDLKRIVKGISSETYRRYQFNRNLKEVDIVFTGENTWKLKLFSALTGLYIDVMVTDMGDSFHFSVEYKKADGDIIETTALDATKDETWYKIADALLNTVANDCKSLKRRGFSLEL